MLFGLLLMVYSCYHDGEPADGTEVPASEAFHQSRCAFECDDAVCCHYRGLRACKSGGIVILVDDGCGELEEERCALSLAL